MNLIMLLPRSSMIFLFMSCKISKLNHKISVELLVLFCLVSDLCGVAGNVVRSPYGVVHGKSSPVYYNEKEEDSLFAGLSK